MGSGRGLVGSGGVPWRILGVPGGYLKVPFGWSLEVPARLASQDGRFVGSLGGALEGPTAGEINVAILSCNIVPVPRPSGCTG